MYDTDPDDDWSRFLARLRERRTALTADVIAGGCGPAQYADYCGRIAEIDVTVELVGTVRRGEDRKPPARAPIRSVED